MSYNYHVSFEGGLNMSNATKPRAQWVITKDMIDDVPGYAAGTRSAGSTLPKLKGEGKTSEEIAKLARAEGMTQRFRLLDDDGTPYYEGLMMPFEMFGDEDAVFSPLDDFGRGNAGCTELQYWANGTWETA
jgi:hypothetical protein